MLPHCRQKLQLKSWGVGRFPSRGDGAHLAFLVFTKRAPMSPPRSPWVGGSVEALLGDVEERREEREEEDEE